MIKPVTYEDIIKLLRKTIIERVGISSNKVLNALSIRGTDLSKELSETQVNSFAACDTLILFELLKDENGENYTTPKNDEQMLVISSYIFHIMIYGNGSDECSKKLRAIFRQPGIALDLREKGLFIKNCSAGETINEFINNTMLLRNDLELRFETVSNTDKIIEQEYFKNNDLTFDDAIVVVNEI